MRDPTFDPRAAGQVTRYHTWPRLRDQSVGEHTWQVLRIVLTVWPDCPRKLLHYIVFHDVGEMAGDIPYPFKLKVPELATAMTKAERLVLDGMHITGIPVLNKYEHAFFKCCECIEMWEWGLFEQSFGNQFAQLVGTRMILQASEWASRLTNRGEHPDVRPAINRYIQRRLDSEKHESSKLAGDSGEDRRGADQAKGGNV